MLNAIDEQILQLALFNKRAAFELAYDTYWQDLYRQAYRKTQSTDLSKDLVQEVFCAFWENMDTLSIVRHLQNYLFGVLRNKTLMQFERSGVHLRYAMKLATRAEDMEASVHQALTNKELEGVINAEINKMPPRMKNIFLLKKEKDYSIREIAQQLEISEQTVKNQLQNAYNRLKTGLQGYDINLAIAGMVFISVLSAGKTPHHPMC
ncbi:MAG: sigma-70 family RNA polymerase sigma factor [Bacteroidota bacterium]